MNRNGKIGRLPREVREQLNQRLAQGEPGVTLLPWLNELPAAKALLAQQFEGTPITKQNLSEWRAGGFREWEMRHELLASSGDLAADAAELSKSTQGNLTDHLSTLLAARYASLLHGWNGEVDKKLTGKLRVLHDLTHDLTQLRRGDHQNKRWQLEQDQLEEQRETSREELFAIFWDWLRVYEIRQILRSERGKLPPDPGNLRQFFGLEPRHPDTVDPRIIAKERAARAAKSQPPSPAEAPAQSTPAEPARDIGYDDDDDLAAPTTSKAPGSSEAPKSGVAPVVPDGTSDLPPSPSGDGAGPDNHSKTSCDEGESAAPARPAESDSVQPVAPSETALANPAETPAVEPVAPASENPVQPSPTESDSSDCPREPEELDCTTGDLVDEVRRKALMLRAAQPPDPDSPWTYKG